MDANNLKYVVGKAEKDKPAIIRFFSAVDEYSISCFKDEFLWLQDYVKPSKIVVMINSEGGSVLYGMSAFSIINNCPIEVDCVIEGIAASMASIIWAAGDNLFMHDYSLLMIHNPFNSKTGNDDPTVKQTVEAFRSQLETIYTKRFGLSKEKVTEIMNGEGEADGTFFSAKDAVKAGFLPSENVIKTSKKIRDKVKNEMAGIESTAEIRNIMSNVSAEVDVNNLLEAISSAHQEDNYSQIQDRNKMEQDKNEFLDSISAKLGLSKDTQATAIEARIAELVSAEKSLNETKSELDAVKIQLKGKEAELANVNSELTTVKASLQEYKNAEQEARVAEIENVVDEAIKAGKIEASAKEAWTKMAETNFETVKSTLASIQARENITQEIANDPANKEHVEEALKETEAKMQEAIKEHIGDVKLNRF